MPKAAGFLRRRGLRWSALLLILAAAPAASEALFADLAAGTTVLVSRSTISSDGMATAARAVSADGRFVAFESDSAHLIAGQNDANLSKDVFLYDRTTRQTILVSRSTASPTTTGNGLSALPSLSADGRYVAFVSTATDLAPEAAPSDYLGLYLFDRIAGTTRFIAATEPAESTTFPLQLPLQRQISTDGRWVVFTSDYQISGNVFLWDAQTGSTTLVSHTSAGPLVPGGGELPTLSADGRYVAFLSSATDLVPGQTGSAGIYNLFLWDRVTGATLLVSHDPSSPVTQGGAFEAASLSDDGRFVLYTGPGALDPSVPSPGGTGYLLYDRASGVNRRIAVQHRSGYGPALSADGRWVVLGSELGLVAGVAPGPMEIYLYDRIARTFTLVTRAVAGSSTGSQGHPGTGLGISDDGRTVAFASDATDLVAGQIDAHHGLGNLDLFLFDRVTGVTTLITHPDAAPLTGAGGSVYPLLSADGRTVAFTCFAQLVAGDLNPWADAYVFHLDPAPAGPVPIPPCTVFDGLLRSNVRQALAAAGSCGVPGTAKGLRVKVTARQGTAQGNVRLYPGSVTAPAVGTLRFQRGQTVSASFDLPPATTSAGAVLPFVRGNGTVRVTVEVEGYIP